MSSAMSAWSTRGWCKAWCKAWCAVLLALFVGATADAQDSSSEVCDSDIERVKGSSKCLGQKVPCRSPGTTITYQGVSVSSSGWSGKCCLTTLHIPDHDKKVAGNLIVWSYSTVPGVLEFRECTGSGRFLFITWGSDRCRFVGSKSFGAYPILQSKLCPITEISMDC